MDWDDTVAEQDHLVGAGQPVAGDVTGRESHHPLDELGGDSSFVGGDGGRSELSLPRSNCRFIRTEGSVAPFMWFLRFLQFMPGPNDFASPAVGVGNILTWCAIARGRRLSS